MASIGENMGKILQKNIVTKYLPEKNILPVISKDATIRNSEIIGDVTIEENVHIVNAVIRSDEGTPFYISSGVNIQDFAVLHGYTTQENGVLNTDNLISVENKGIYSIFIDKNTSISHGVLIHGPCFIGKNSFIGFKSSIDRANIGKNVEIGSHSYIYNVSIPDNTAISPGAIITNKADILRFTTKQTNINEKIVKVNIEMAKAYKNWSY